jgi:hypothetical protein
MMMRLFFLALAPLYLGSALDEENSAVGDLSHVRGVTISCHSWDWEWGQPEFGDELDRLQAMGVNWVAIHPYASIRADGQVNWKAEALDPENPAVYLSFPIEAAHARGMGILIKPHLAYWGSSFGWRGEIEFELEEQRARFWEQYSAWILSLAKVTSAADSICIGTELDRMLASESQWRDLIKRLRAVTSAHLTYASNWDKFEEVPFWDDLDVIGVQAYFPLSESEHPSDDDLRAGWQQWLTSLKALHTKTGKPVVFTELGYDDARQAASRPWEDDERGRGSATNDEVLALQERCLDVALGVMAKQEAWLRGAFLWKWFVGPGRRGGNGRSGGSFRMDRPAMHGIIRAAWGTGEAAALPDGH